MLGVGSQQAEGTTSLRGVRRAGGDDWSDDGRMQVLV